MPTPEPFSGVDSVCPDSFSRSRNAQICAQLAIERAKAHVAHLHALMFLCDPPDFGLDPVVAENVRAIMAQIHADLSLGVQNLVDLQIAES